LRRSQSQNAFAVLAGQILRQESQHPRQHQTANMAGRRFEAGKSLTAAEILKSRLSGGRSCWAHFEFTRINIEPTILRKKIEDLREARTFDVNRASVPY
jgi:hypothetical protein